MERDLVIAPGADSFGIQPDVLELTGADPPRALSDRIVLIVEDEWLVRLELVDALEAAGWTVAESNSGEAAITMLDKGGRFDLVITDIRLHGAMSGWDVADAFRAENPGIGIIYASGNTALAERQVSGSTFISKPVRIEELVAACERIWEAASGDPSN